MTISNVVEDRNATNEFGLTEVLNKHELPEDAVSLGEETIEKDEHLFRCAPPGSQYYIVRSRGGDHRLVEFFYIPGETVLKPY